MDDIHDRIKESERGRLARQLLDNPLWSEAWDTLAVQLMAAWRESRPEQVEYREDIHRNLKAATAVQRAIEEIAQTGRLAEMQIEEHQNHGR